MATVRTNLGKVAMTPKEDWSDSTSYLKLDIVNKNGTYIAKKDVPAGTPVTNTEYWMKLFSAQWGSVAGKIEDQTDLYTILENHERRFDDLDLVVKYKRYGASGIGQSANALTCLYDAVGMSWSAVKDENGNHNIVSDFYDAAPWKARKCVGTWGLDSNGNAKFTVNAYLGDDDYTEDGSNGDYVAVEYPVSYYSFDGSTLVISGHKYPGYRAFDIFCVDHDQSKVQKYYYGPAYAMGLDENGNGASLPGLDNCQGSYNSLMTEARKYKNQALGNLAVLEQQSFQFYILALLTVESATQQAETFAKGCISLRHSNDDTCTFTDATHVLVSNYYATRVVGEYVAVIASNVDLNNASYKASHRIVSITRCDSTGAASASGTYTLIELEDLGKAYYEYDTTGATTYRFVARPWRTGSCNALTAPSGYIGDNDGYHPMRYLYTENIYGNQYGTVSDFFSLLKTDENSEEYLEHYLLLDPGAWNGANPTAANLETDAFEKLGITTEHANYKSGYIKSKKYDEKYPDCWIPYETTGASATTYFCDYASLVSSHVVRSRRVRGTWSTGSYVGPSLVHLHNAPSNSNAHYGGCLCVVQKGGELVEA